MKKIYFLVTGFLVGVSCFGQVKVGPAGEKFSVRIVAAKLSDPWSVAYGPDQGRFGLPNLKATG